MTKFKDVPPGLFRDLKGFVWAKLAADHPAKDANNIEFNAVKLMTGEMKLFLPTDEVIET